MPKFIRDFIVAIYLFLVFLSGVPLEYWRTEDASHYEDDPDPDDSNPNAAALAVPEWELERAPARDDSGYQEMTAEDWAKAGFALAPNGNVIRVD